MSVAIALELWPICAFQPVILEVVGPTSHQEVAYSLSAPQAMQASGLSFKKR